MSGINVYNVTRKVKLPEGNYEFIFKNFNLTVGENEIIGLFGPNGCGKTTLLNMISGIMKPDSGEILIFGKNPSVRKIAYIFQDYQSSLFPWLSAKDNILFPLSIKKIKKKEMNSRLDCLTGQMKMPFDLNKYPYQLSGGQQQYVSIMRGLIANPAIMLVDEPFSSLDYANGIWLMEKTAEIFRKIKIPSIIVAHDIEYLIYLCEKIYFISDKPAKIIREKYIHPADSKELKGIKLELQNCYP